MTLKQMYNSSILKAYDRDIAKAEAKGIDQGISQGLNQGTSQVAKAMKTAGEAVSKIMNYTGLSRREIAAL